MAVSNKDLKAKLGAALTDKKPLPISPPGDEVTTQTTAPQKRREERGGKTSVNLFESDLELLEFLRDFLKKEGFRKVADSQLLRLMCRDYQPGPSTVETMRQIMSEDGRRRAS